MRKIATGTTGSEIAEAALVLPILFMLLLGIYWFGRAFNVYATINHAAREGARVAVAQSCAAPDRKSVV
jgi:Flp pilus assembly protein TadG